MQTVMPFRMLQWPYSMMVHGHTISGTSSDTYGQNSVYVTKYNQILQYRIYQINDSKNGITLTHNKCDENLLLAMIIN